MRRKRYQRRKLTIITLFSFKLTPNLLKLRFLPLSQNRLFLFMYWVAIATSLFGALLWIIDPTPVIAQTSVNGNDVVLGSLDQAQSVQQSFDKLWNQYLSGPAYRYITTTASLIAALSSVLWLTFNYKNITESFDEILPLIFRFFVGPITVAILFQVQLGGYNFLAYSTLGVRNAMNTFTNQVLANLVFDVNDPVSSGLTKVYIEQLQTAGLQNCLTKSSQEERNACLNQLQSDVQTALQPYLSQQWAQDSLNQLKDKISALTQNPLQAVLSKMVEAVGGFTNQTIIFAILTIVNMISGAVTWIIEILGVLSAMVGPLAISISLMPWFSDMWQVWLKMLVGTGLVALFYKLCVGLVSTQVLFAQGPIQLIGPTALSLLSVFIISSLSNGASSAAFQSSASAGASASGTIGGAAAGLATGGIGVAARSIVTNSAAIHGAIAGQGKSSSQESGGGSPAGVPSSET